MSKEKEETNKIIRDYFEARTTLLKREQEFLGALFGLEGE